MRKGLSWHRRHFLPGQKLEHLIALARRIATLAGGSLRPGS